MQTRNPLRRRGGFTLIELLISIVIISILIALLFPALGAMRQNVRIAQVRTEISGLETALNDFKAKFGDYPPSRIKLFHNAAGWNTVDANATQEALRLQSRAVIRRFWPQFNFAQASYPWPATVELRGAECLVFFLGGVSRTNANPIDLIGFSNNPATPFDQSSTSRTGPFFEFKGSLETDGTISGSSRLQDSILAGTGSGAYHFLAYRDTLPSQTQPMIYASGYDGQGYNALDVQFDSTYMNTSQVRLSTSAYAQSASGSAWNAKSFQIISPGFDGQFGAGGAWSESQADALLTGSTRNVERDNITNFHSGILAPN